MTAIARGFAAILLLAIAAAAAPAHAEMFPSTYDDQIRQAAERWWPGVPWRLLKAQLFQESHLDPNARSERGAEGIAQFMGPTWQQIMKQMGYDRSLPRSETGPAIEAAAYYMAQLRQRWNGAANDEQQHSFGLGSYNAGPRNIRRAANRCNSHAEWNTVVPCLPDILGAASRQTIAYVKSVWRYWGLMEGGV